MRHTKMSHSHSLDVEHDFRTLSHSKRLQITLEDCLSHSERLSKKELAALHGNTWLATWSKQLGSGMSGSNTPKTNPTIVFCGGGGGVPSESAACVSGFWACDPAPYHSIYRSKALFTHTVRSQKMVIHGGASSSPSDSLPFPSISVSGSHFNGSHPPLKIGSHPLRICLASCWFSIMSQTPRLTRSVNLVGNPLVGISGTVTSLIYRRSYARSLKYNKQTTDGPNKPWMHKHDVRST